MPRFSTYFIKQGVLFTIGAFGYGYFLFKKELKKETLGIYTLAFLPFLAYNMMYFDVGPFRSYASFLPMLVLITVLWLDHFSSCRYYRMAAGIAVAATVLFSYRYIGTPEDLIEFFITPQIYIYILILVALLWPGHISVRRLCYLAAGIAAAAVICSNSVDITGFYKVPYIYNETMLDNYGSMISQAQNAIAGGRKCIALWWFEHQMRTFELDIETEYAISTTDSINRLHGYTEEDLLELLEYLNTTREPYVLLLGNHSDWYLDPITPEFRATLLERYPYDEYTDKGYLFYIN